MNPYVTSLVAKTVIADRLAAAEAYRLAKAARVGRTSRKMRLSRRLPGRGYRSIELLWPDGVRSLVSAPEQSASPDNQASGLAGSRR